MILWILLALVLLDLCVLEPRRWARAREAQRHAANRAVIRAELRRYLRLPSEPQLAAWCALHQARPVQSTDDPALLAVVGRARREW